jgi:hypothetical protein
MTSSYDRARGSVSSHGSDCGTCCRALSLRVLVLLLLRFVLLLLRLLLLLVLLLGLRLFLVLRRGWWICRLGLR